MTTQHFFRGRRLRSSAAIRAMFQESLVTPYDLMMPYFVVETKDKDLKKAIASMPGQYQLSVSQLEKQVTQAVDMGLQSCMLFGIPATKDAKGSGAYAEDGIVQQAVARLKDKFPELIIATDVCLCEYTDHGHCGIIDTEDTRGRVKNDATLPFLAKVALSHARAGADMVAPSDMMDGRVAALREALDEHGFKELPVMSYAVKYASAFYGPFRDAAESAPRFGDRKTYQMNAANHYEALREAMADMDEGADILMVKPGMPYLDILRTLRDTCDLPLAAYQVSGEYAMLQAAIMSGWGDKEALIGESLVAFKRAGADLILSYFTEDFLKMCQG